MTATNNELEQKIKDQLEILENHLKRSGLWPVKRKVYNMIINRLEEVRCSIYDHGNSVSSCDVNRIQSILDSMDVSKLNSGKSLAESTAWDIADALKEFLPKIASESYLYSALIEEKKRVNKDFLWKDYFDEHSLNKHINSYESDALTFNRDLVANRLVTLYRIRNDAGRHNRARDGVRSRYLKYMGILLFIAVLAVAGLWYLGTIFHEFWLQLLIVAIAGAIGAILSRAMKLRDLNLIVELKAARSTLFSQASFGSILAVIVLLILKTGIIEIAGFNMDAPDLSVLFIIGLISGFSEPFALGLMEKVSSMGK